MSDSRARRRYERIQRFCAAFLSFPTIEGASKSVGISAKTATRWLKTPEFKRAYIELNSPDLPTISAKVTAAALGAIDALAATAHDPKAPATARVNASTSIVQLMLKITEDVSFAEEIKKLKEITGIGDDQK